MTVSDGSRAGGCRGEKAAGRIRAVFAGAVLLLGAIFCAAGVRAGDASSGWNNVAVPLRAIPDFVLIDQDSRSFASSALRGRTSLIFFGFTHCRDVCPATLQKMRLIRGALGNDAHDLASVMISVDGQRDTPAAMKAYVGPLGPGFIGLTGDPTAVRKVADSFAAIFFKGMPTDNAGGYDVEHTSQLYLVDKDGNLRSTFYGGTVEQIAEVTRQVIRDRR